MATELLNITINQDDIEKAISNAAKARTELDKLKAANKELEKQKKDLAKAEGDNTQAIEQLNKQIAKNNTQIKTASSTVRENEKIVVANTQAQQANEGSITQLRRQLGIVSQQWANLSKNERENTEEGKRLSKQKLELTERLKAEEKATGDTRRNVGNYTESVKEALEESGLFGKQLAMVKQAQQAYAAATKLASKATRTFRAALISTGIGAIVVAIGSLVAAFASTQKGADAISKALQPVKAVFQSLIGIAQDLSLRLFDAFKNPKQAVTDLWEAIKTNIVNRITAIPTLFKSVFDTVVSAFSFLGNSIKSVVADIPIIGKGIDKAAAKKNADEAAAVLKQSIVETGQAVIQFQTGLDKEQQKQLAGFVKGQQDRVKAAADAGKQIAALTVQIEETEIDLTKRRAKLNAEFERSREISEDNSRSEEERRAAAVKAIEAQDELLERNQAFLDLQIEKKKLELSLNDTDREAKLELAQLEAERTQFEAEASAKKTSARNFLEALDTEIQNKNLSRIKELEEAEEAARQAKLAREAELQEIIEQEELIRIENEKARLAEQRAEGLLSKQEYEEALVQIELDTIQKAREAAELARQEALNSTELTELEKRRIILESEQIIADARQKTAKLSIAAQEKTTDVVEKTEEKKKEVSISTANDIAKAAGDLAGENTAVAKASGIAQATISTYNAATAALSLPPVGAGPIAGIPLAAFTVAKGLANVAKIAGIGFADGGFTGSGYGSPDSSGYKPAGIVHEGEYVIKKSMVENPNFAPIVSFLENSRLRGYADGGMVGRTASLPAIEGSQASQLQASITELRNIQPIVKVTDINRVSGQAQMVRVSGEL